MSNPPVTCLAAPESLAASALRVSPFCGLGVVTCDVRGHSFW